MNWNSYFRNFPRYAGTVANKLKLRWSLESEKEALTVEDRIQKNVSSIVYHNCKTPGHKTKDCNVKAKMEHRGEARQHRTAQAKLTAPEAE